MRVVSTCDGADLASDGRAANGIIETWRATLSIHEASFVPLLEVLHGLTGGFFLVDATILFTRCTRDTLP